MNDEEPRDEDLDTIPVRRGGCLMVVALFLLLGSTFTLALHRVYAGGGFTLSGALFALAGRVPNLGFGLAENSEQQEKTIARVVGAALLASGIYLLMTPDR